MRRSICALIAAIAFLTTSRQPAAQSPDALGGLAVGAGIKVFSDKVKEVIEKAEGSTELLSIQMAGHLSILLQQAQAAFAADTDKFWNDLSGTQQSALTSLKSVLTDFEYGAKGTLDDVSTRIQETANAFPFADRLPQLYSFKPGFISTTGPRTTRLLLGGSFFDIPRDGYDATVTIGSMTFVNAEKTTHQLGFDIPVSLLTSTDNALTLNRLVVKIPHRDRTFLFFHSKETTTFIVPVTVLPSSAGTLTIESTTTTLETETRTVEGPAPGSGTNGMERFRQNSDGFDDIICRGEHADMAIHKLAPDPGYSVVPTSVTWILLGSRGDFNLESNCSTGVEACLCVNTRYHAGPFGTSGAVDFHMRFQETKPVTHQSTSSQTVSLQWDVSKVLAIPLNATWTATYSFLGKEKQFSTNYDDDLIRVHQNGRSLQVMTAPFVH